MKSLRKSILTLLALTLFGGAGAWAQNTVSLPLDTDASTNWGEYLILNGIKIQANDDDASWGISALNSNAFFMCYESEYVTYTISMEDGSPITGISMTISSNLAMWQSLDGWTANGDIRTWSGNATSVSFRVNHNDTDGDYATLNFSAISVTYAPAAPAEIELTKSGANQWTLGQTPDYDLELQVEYYQPHTLDSIPMGWQVKVGNAAPVHPSPYPGGNTTLGYLTITETDSVELIPPADVKPNVKNVTLVDNSTPAVVEPITVTINQSDWGDWDTPITKDGVTVSAGMIDPNEGNLMNGGTFSTTLGNFTQIVVTTAGGCYASGTGWSGNYSSKTWAGTPASTVSFSDGFMGMGGGITIVCTIQPGN